MDSENNKQVSMREMNDQNQNELPNPVDLSRHPTGNSMEQHEELIQISQEKRQPIGNKEDFERVYRQVLEEAKRQSLQADQMRRKKQERAKEKKAPLPPIKLTPKQLKQKTILLAIEPHIKNYVLANGAANYASLNQVGRLRCQFRKRTFKSLLYGIQQLAYPQPSQELSEEQKKVVALTAKQRYALAKTLSTAIDVQVLRALNKGDKINLNSNYKSFVENFIKCIDEQSNLILRRRILSKDLDVKSIPTYKQDYFYSPTRQSWIIEQQERILRQNTRTERPVYRRMSQDQIIEYQAPTSSVTAIQKIEQPKPKYKFVDNGTFQMFKILLGSKVLENMKSTVILQQRPQIQRKLRENFAKVFQYQM